MPKFIAYGELIGIREFACDRKFNLFLCLRGRAIIHLIDAPGGIHLRLSEVALRYDVLATHPSGTASAKDSGE